MKILISPAKSLDFDSELSVKDFSKPFFEKEDRIRIEKIQNVPKKYEKKKMRLTLDYEEDFLFLKNIILLLYLF